MQLGVKPLPEALAIARQLDLDLVEVAAEANPPVADVFRARSHIVRATRKLLEFLNDPNARAATNCERALLNRMGGGCQVPIGAFAEMKNGKLHLESVVANPDGSQVLRDSRDGDDPVHLGEAAAAELLRRGGDKILVEVYKRNSAPPQQP